MTVVRELVTKLSFNVDRRGIENFNRSIIGFKTKFALATTAVGGFIGGVVKTLNAVSDTVLETDFLARSIGLATKEVVGLQKASQEFRITPQQFQGAFLRLNDLIRQAQSGMGELFNLARDLEIEIRDDAGNFLSTQQIFFEILKTFEKIDDEVLRIDLSKRVLGVAQFADIAKVGADEFERMSKANEVFGEAFEKNNERALRYERTWNRLSDNFTDILYNVLPPLFDFTADFFGEINKGFDEYRKGTFWDYLKDSIKDFVIETETDLGIRSPAKLAGAEILNRRVDVNTNITIQPPTGTEESQKRFFVESAESAFDEMFNNKFEGILNNYPVTEQ